MPTEPPKAEPPTRKRRCFQFSLRTLLMLVLICAIGSAWVAPRLQRAQCQNTAVEAILKDEGVVWYDFEVNAEASNSGRRHQRINMDTL